MANYINHTNQTLLWNTVNKLPDFQKLSPPKKDFEFKKTIENIYNTSCRNKQFLTLQELQQLNRETILAFVRTENSEKTRTENSEKPPLYPQIQPQPQSQRPLYETKQEQSQRQFEERQNIYKQMNSKPELPSPEIFKDKIEDTAIENMDALIQQYQKQREMEFQQYTPPPPPVSVSNQTSVSNKPKPKIRILDNNVSLNSIDIDIDIEEANINKKNVSWSTNPNIEYVIDDYWYKKLEEANKAILKLEKRVFLLEEKLMDNEIKQEVTFAIEKIIQQI